MRAHGALDYHLISWWLRQKFRFPELIAMFGLMYEIALAVMLTANTQAA
jgi:hypothetical protein